MEQSVLAKERLEENQKILDDYEAKLKLPKMEAPGEPDELQEYLSMPMDIIERLTPDRAIAITIRLSQYSLYLQRQMNKHKSIITWVEEKISKVVASEIDHYDKYTKTEIKIAQISAKNTEAAQLQQIKQQANQIIDRLYDLSSGIKSLSYVFSLAYKSKMGDRNE